MLQLEMALSGRLEDTTEAIDKANMRALRQLDAGSEGRPKPKPLPHMRRKRT